VTVWLGLLAFAASALQAFVSARYTQGVVARKKRWAVLGGGFLDAMDWLNLGLFLFVSPWFALPAIVGGMVGVWLAVR
jgi:hypothetical protein